MWDDLVKEADIDNDGHIDLNEFVVFMQKLEWWFKVFLGFFKFFSIVYFVSLSNLGNYKKIFLRIYLKFKINYYISKNTNLLIKLNFQYLER